MKNRFKDLKELHELYKLFNRHETQEETDENLFEYLNKELCLNIKECVYLKNLNNIKNFEIIKSYHHKIDKYYNNYFVKSLTGNRFLHIFHHGDGDGILRSLRRQFDIYEKTKSIKEELHDFLDGFNLNLEELLFLVSEYEDGDTKKVEKWFTEWQWDQIFDYYDEYEYYMNS